MPNVIDVCVQMSSPRCVTYCIVCVVEFSTLILLDHDIFRIRAVLLGLPP